MWNEVFKQHSEDHPGCEGFLSWDSTGEEQRGLVWRERAKCSRCSYVSKRYELYTEIGSDKRGRRKASINRGLCAGLTQTPIGLTSFRRLCEWSNVPPPSKKGLQNICNDISDDIIDLNKVDMADQCAKLKEVKKYRNDPSLGIPVEGDGMYNNPLYSGVGKTPFQPATQVTYTVIENVTHKKKIINLVTKNKLCSENGKHPNACGPDNARCTVTLAMEKSIGQEKTWAKEAISGLLNKGLEVSHITTDPDTTAYLAAEEIWLEGQSKTKPQGFIDTRHLNENVRKKLRNDKTLISMMPAQNVEDRDRMCNRFSCDLSMRCSAEFQTAFSQFKADKAKLKRKLSNTVDAVTMCYMGSHDLCKKHSFVCRGGRNKWLRKSAFLPNTFQLADTPEIESKIRECVNRRLGPNVLDKTILNSNTQKTEGVNRIIRRSLPRFTTFKRNFQCRAHSAVHVANLGPGESTVKLAKHLGSPVVPGSRVAKSLQNRQTCHEQDKLWKKSDRYKKTRYQKRCRMFKLYEKVQEMQKTEEVYKKAQLLQDIQQRKPQEKAARLVIRDHGYTLRPSKDHENYTKLPKIPKL